MEAFLHFHVGASLLAIAVCQSAHLPCRALGTHPPPTDQQPHTTDIEHHGCHQHVGDRNADPDVRHPKDAVAERVDHVQHRSEEHTSELQSLMRISYAVFCLKKKNKQQQTVKKNN